MELFSGNLWRISWVINALNRAS